MRRVSVSVVTLVAVLLSAVRPAVPQSPGVTLDRMPERLEVRFALSALPPHLRDQATAYVLDPARGYTVSQKGSNGLTCIVVRSDWQFPEAPFRNDIYWPVCYDAEG